MEYFYLINFYNDKFNILTNAVFINVFDFFSKKNKKTYVFNFVLITLLYITDIPHNPNVPFSITRGSAIYR